MFFLVPKKTVFLKKTSFVFFIYITSYEHLTLHGE